MVIHVLPDAHKPFLEVLVYHQISIFLCAIINGIYRDFRMMLALFNSGIKSRKRFLYLFSSASLSLIVPIGIITPSHAKHKLVIKMLTQSLVASNFIHNSIAPCYGLNRKIQFICDFSR